MIEGDGKTFAVSFVMHMEETVGVRSLQAAMYPKEAASDSFCRYEKNIRLLCGYRL
jgi:hypothetical protein